MTETQTRASTGDPQAARAEELVGDVTHRVDDWADRVADWVARAAARTREEAEDIWAEAQSLRR